MGYYYRNAACGDKTSVCDLCGCQVGDRSIHDTWHNKHIVDLTPCEHCHVPLAAGHTMVCPANNSLPEGL